MMILVCLIALTHASSERPKLSIRRGRSPELLANLQNLSTSEYWNPNKEIKKVQETRPILDKIQDAKPLLHDSEQIRASQELIFKSFEADTAEDETGVSKIEKEILMQSTAHKLLPTMVPNILRDYFEDKTNPEFPKCWIVMEKAKGMALLEFVQSEDWNENKADKIFMQIKAALRVLHENNFAHNDLHLENIFVSPELEVSIIDFGESQENKKFEADNVALKVIKEILYDNDLNSRKEASDRMPLILGSVRQKGSPAFSEASTSFPSVDLEPLESESDSEFRKN